MNPKKYKYFLNRGSHFSRSRRSADSAGADEAAQSQKRHSGGAATKVSVGLGNRGKRVRSIRGDIASPRGYVFFALRDSPCFCSPLFSTSNLRAPNGRRRASISAANVALEARGQVFEWGMVA